MSGRYQPTDVILSVGRDEPGANFRGIVVVVVVGGHHRGTTTTTTTKVVDDVMDLSFQGLGCILTCGGEGRKGDKEGSSSGG